MRAPFHYKKIQLNILMIESQIDGQINQNLAGGVIDNDAS